MKSEQPFESATGQCFCGAIKFKLKGQPLWIGHCHCTSCRRNTGAPVTTFVGASDHDLDFNGEPRAIYESSPGVRRGFCQNCGTPMTYEADQYPGEVHIYISTMDQPERFPPQHHVHYAKRISWFDIQDEIPRHQRSSKA